MATKRADNRRLIVIGAIGGVLVLVLLAVTFMGGGDGGKTSSTTTLAPGSTTSRVGGTTTTTTPGSPSVPGGSFDVFATKDPFQPVVDLTPTDTGGTGGASSTTSPSGTGGSTTGGSATGGGTSGGGSATGGTGTGGGSASPAAPTSVALLDVFVDGTTTKAQVRVGSTVYTVAAGETFATSYRVVSLSGTCGQFVFGDSPFQLCEGEEVIK